MSVRLVAFLLGEHPLGQRLELNTLFRRRRGPQLAHRPNVLGEPVVVDVLEAAQFLGPEQDRHGAMVRARGA